VQVKQTYFWANQGQPSPCPLQNLIHVFLGLFEQKFTTDSYGVKSEGAWCCWKAWEKSGSQVPIFYKKIRNSSP
jgi:hypothetical protein